jgi:hypothetical protein
MSKQYVISAYSVTGSPIKGMCDVKITAATLNEAAQTYRQLSKHALDVMIEADDFILLGGLITVKAPQKRKSKTQNEEGEETTLSIPAIARFLVAHF